MIPTTYRIELMVSSIPSVLAMRSSLVAVKAKLTPFNLLT